MYREIVCNDCRKAIEIIDRLNNFAKNIEWRS
ncbi:MAG: hypothetical protein ACI8XB_003100 [Patiriisocius sp.]|jgi:hypothetical protein